MITVITGAPASGKSTYVRENAAPGDLRVDFDAIAQVLTFGADPHDVSNTIQAATRAARDAVIAYVLGGIKVDSWIIHTSPTSEQVAAYEAAGAEFVTIDPGMETVLSQAEQDGRPEWTAAAIRKWYAKKKISASKNTHERGSQGMDQKPMDIRATLHLTAAAGAGRKIIAEIVRYGEVGFTSMGATIFEPGSINIHADKSRVKMLEMHDQERSLGYMVDAEDSQEKLVGTFYVAETPAGDSALEGVRNKTRDAVSLGVTVEDYSFSDAGELIVKSSTLNETSLVTIPAFSESRVQEIAAARQEKKKMDPEQQPAAPAKVEAQQQPAAPAKVEAAQQLAPVMAAPEVHAAGAENGMSLSVLASKISEAGSMGGVSAVNQLTAKATPNLFMTAALTDVVPADDAGLTTSVTRPQWFGEIWKARRVSRPTVDSVENEALTSMKGYGYSVVYPTTDPKLINEYAGAKAAVPASGKVTTKPEAWTAKRKAGGWDVDRAYFDFNDQAFIEITLRAAYDDYLKQTEAELVAAMTAAGVSTSGADVLELLTMVGGDAAALGSVISKIQFAPDLWAQFTGLTSAEAPWWLRNQGSINLGTVSGNAGGLGFNVNPDLAAGTMLAHDRRAVTFRETPLIRVQAENIANGGIDLGVFGYMSHTINDSRAIFTGTIAAEPAV